MNYQFSRANLLYFVLILLGISFFQNNGIAQSNNSRFESNVKYVNGYKVVKGERPPIDLATVPVDAFEQGKIYVKFTSAAKHLISDNEIVANQKGYIATGLKGFDDYCNKHRVVSAKQSISNLYKINSKAKSQKLKHEAWGLNLWYELSLGDDVDIKKAVSDFQQLAEVEIAEPVYKIRLIEPIYSEEIKQSKRTNSKAGDIWVPNDEYYKNNQWHYNNTGQDIGGVGTVGVDIDLEKAWALEKGNPSVIVAVMDGGIDFKHPDLNANMWSQIGPDGENTKPCKQNHGTHVGGTVAAVSNNSIGVAGVAGGSGIGDGVRLMTLDIFEGSHGLNDLGLYIYSADNGAAISQNSWGYQEPGVYNKSALEGIDYFIKNGGGDALLEGGIVIFAAGNDNDNGKWYPAYYSATMAVASYDNKGKKSSFSNYGNWVDITAPGTNILSTYNVDQPNGELSYNFMSGTSMACPHVSGVAALVVSHAYGQITKTKLWNVLVHGVDDVYSINPSYKGKLGSGRLNAYKALLSIPEFIASLTIVSEDGDPIQNLEISINGIKYNSDSEGKVTLMLMFGEYTYKIETKGYKSMEGIFEITDSDVSIKIVPLFERNIVDFTIVNEGKDREPIQNAEIIVNDAKYNSNSEGKVTITLNYGEYTYEVSTKGYTPTDGDFSVSGSDVSIGLVLLAEDTNYPKINGEQNVCNGSNVIYSIQTTDNGIFEVLNGGIIDNLDENSILVKWKDETKGKIHFRFTDEDGFITTVSDMVSIDNKYVLTEVYKPKISKKGSIPILICTTPDLQYKWFFEGNEVSGQTRQDYAPRGLTGNFRVQTIDNNQCPNTSDAVSVTSVATSDIEVSVFPNPANKVFNVSFTSEDTGDGIIIISNSYGKVVFQESITKNNPRWEKRYQLNELTQGVYIVKVILNNSITASSRVTVY